MSVTAATIKFTLSPKSTRFSTYMRAQATAIRQRCGVERPDLLLGMPKPLDVGGLLHTLDEAISGPPTSPA